VLVIERGDECGQKNMTGGRLYGHSLEKIIPNFAEEAPIERTVTREKISIMSEGSCLDIGFGSTKLSATPETASYTVLRAKFDKWLAEKAEEAGEAVEEKVEEAAEAVEEKAEEATEAVADAANAAEEKAEAATEAVENAAEAAGEAVDGATKTAEEATEEAAKAE
jgi:flavin-dependent dehydrogenase